MTKVFSSGAALPTQVMRTLTSPRGVMRPSAEPAAVTTSDDVVTDAARGSDPGVLGTVISELLREGLAQGTDRASLDAMLTTIGVRLGYEAILVARHEDDELVLVGSHGHAVGDEVSRPPERYPVGQGLAGAAFTSGRPARTDDAREDPRWFDVSNGRNRSGLCLPMRLPDRVWGVIGVEAEAPGAFDDGDVALLQPLADTMAWVLESVRLRQEADLRATREERLRRGLEASTAVIAAGLEATDLQTAFDRMVREIRDRLQWSSVAILLLEGDVIRVVSSYGFTHDIVGYAFHVGRGILGHVATTGEPYLASDTALDPYYEDVVSSTRSELCVPLKLAGRVRGLLNVESEVPGQLTGPDLELAMRIADQMALILQMMELLAAEKDTVGRLHELDRLKSRLLTIASHELRTPLTVVLGLAEMLTNHTASISAEQVREYAATIARQAGMLSRLVDQMTLATELDQGEVSLERYPLKLREIVQLALIGDRGEHAQVGAGVEEMRVLADPLRLRQVLEGLLDNAIKYAAGAGSIEVDARRAGQRVRIQVRDEGPGVPVDERDRVFEPFHQIGEHGVAGRRGVGLGLALARDLVHLMGGELRLEPTSGTGGAVFTIDLPAP